MDNIFDSGRINKADISFYATFFFITIAFVIGFLTSSTYLNFGSIYFDLATLVFILFLLATISKQKVNGWVIFGVIDSQAKMLIAIVIGIAISFVISLNLVSGLTIGIPLSVSASIGASTNSLVNYSVISFYAPLAEELFWVGLLFTSIRKFRNKGIGTSTGIQAAFILTGVIVLLLGITYIGIAGLVIGGLFFALGIMASVPIITKFLNKLPVNIIVVDALLAIFAITALHVYAYGSPLTDPSVFAGASMFFGIELMIDYYMQSIIPSIMMHTVNNAIVGAQALSITPFVILGYSIPAAYVMISLMALFLYGVFRFRYNGTNKQYESISAIKYYANTPNAI